MTRPPVPPIDEASARKKVHAAEDAWNTREPERVAAAYTPDTVWRNRSEFLAGREAVVEFLTRAWAKELDYVLRIENPEFDADGYMRRREASINDVTIAEDERRIFGKRPEEEYGAPLPLR